MYIILVLNLFLFAFVPSNDRAESEKIITMRRIGHKLLLKAGDRTSRVLPVEELSETEYLIAFEKPLAFDPDALVAIIRAEEKSGRLPDAYTVNVYDEKGAIVYAYNMPVNSSESVPCTGRGLPAAHYTIKVSLDDKVSLAWIPACAVPLFLLFGWQWYSRKKAPVAADSEFVAGDYISIGNTKYFPALNKLDIKGETVTLTGKEARVLSLLAENINQDIARDRLQKEIWENEGVIVGRSLDMFISKLRKKLQGDPAIQIINIHGKGYKLTVER